MKVYEIPFAIRSALDNAEIDLKTGEVLNAAAINEVCDNAREKIVNCARYIREQEHEIEAMKQARDAINERMEVKQKKLDWLKRMTVIGLDVLGEKVEMPDIRVSNLSSKKVIVDDNAQLEKRFLTVTTKTAPNKKALKEAIEKGEKIEGARLVTNLSLLIK